MLQKWVSLNNFRLEECEGKKTIIQKYLHRSVFNKKIKGSGVLSRELRISAGEPGTEILFLSGLGPL
jgi:hypothetical protein